jgi:hypothetical protein
VEVAVNKDAKMLDLRDLPPGQLPDGTTAQYSSNFEQYCRDNGYDGIIGKLYRFKGTEGIQVCMYNPNAMKISNWGTSIDSQGNLVKALQNRSRRPQIDGAVWRKDTNTLLMPVNTLADSFPVKEVNREQNSGIQQTR